ncbi:MAG: FeoB-associated Cys-rich membrane protein [Oscillospiraceae bacterium]|nr:FeoB-associated Cys-rich membrane protein [Oscillospiraceae bacterium]
MEIAIIAVIALAVVLALRRIVRMRGSGCSCGCSGCCAECGGACGMKRRREDRSKPAR